MISTSPFFFAHKKTKLLCKMTWLQEAWSETICAEESFERILFKERKEEERNACSGRKTRINWRGSIGIDKELETSGTLILKQTKGFSCKKVYFCVKFFLSIEFRQFCPAVKKNNTFFVKKILEHFIESEYSNMSENSRSSEYSDREHSKSSEYSDSPKND